MLTGKYQNGILPPSSRYATRGKERMPYYAKEKSFQLVDRYMQLAKKYLLQLQNLHLHGF